MRVICNRHGDELGMSMSWYDDEVAVEARSCQNLTVKLTVHCSDI